MKSLLVIIAIAIGMSSCSEPTSTNDEITQSSRKKEVALIDADQQKTKADTFAIEKQKDCFSIASSNFLKFAKKFSNQSTGEVAYDSLYIRNQSGNGDQITEHKFLEKISLFSDSSNAMPIYDFFYGDILLCSDSLFVLSMYVDVAEDQYLDGVRQHLLLASYNNNGQLIDWIRLAGFESDFDRNLLITGRAGKGVYSSIVKERVQDTSPSEKTDTIKYTFTDAGEFKLVSGSDDFWRP